MSVNRGHQINKQKSCFLLGDKAPVNRALIVAGCTGFLQKKFSHQISRVQFICWKEKVTVL